MRASVFTSYGPPDVLSIQEIEIPNPNDDEVLVRVYATTVNRTDCAILRAKPFIMRLVTGLIKPKNTIPGTDFAGKIEAVGKNVSQFNVGDRVFGFNDQGLSSQAEYMTIKADQAMAKMPENLTFKKAAASLEGVHYAINFLNKVRLNPGQKVLVNGATGAIGSALVQLLHDHGAEITAVCSTKNVDLVKALGVHRVIDYLKEDFTRCGDTFDYVLDAVGKSTFAQCKPLLNKKGIYISSELGPWNQNPFLALVTPGLGGKKVIFPIPVNCKKSVLYIQQQIQEGKFDAVIDRAYPLDHIAAAYRYVETGEKIGNVVLELK